MKFADWLKKSGLRPPEMAEKLGITPVAVEHYRDGRRIPRPRIMLAIQKITGGAVKLEDWLK